MIRADSRAGYSHADDPCGARLKAQDEGEQRRGEWEESSGKGLHVTSMAEETE